MDVDEAAAELYGLTPDEFVAARNAMVKRAKAEDGREAAAQIQALRKPTLAAWLVNQLVRAHRSEVSDLLAVGDGMREATAASEGARLRELTSRRKELIDGLITRVRSLADDAGVRAGDDAVDAVNETLLAATADPRAASQVEAGTLTHPLQHVGFGPFGAFGAGDGEDGADVISLSEIRQARGRSAGTAGARAPEKAGGGERDRRRATGRTAAERTKTEAADQAADQAGQERREREREQAEREEAERELRAAEEAVESASERVEEVLAKVDERREEAERAESEVERLTAELESARNALDSARSDLDGAERELDEVRAEAEAALRRRQAAKRRLS
ncbi:hypothetical protein [Phytoactinopolyspora halotolerans]|uniref:Uncharacterized protein n=1 Tax=Phytoactinopolyspora halotolerans TaxID=1981512 RepID=A0A6L9S4W6_9ACTN|nr:hypothetical protein [Phytoactinopolyspora halotolerans]NED99683.1 hypothetical protein [Phytoactinopolyspora halotolerans]